MTTNSQGAGQEKRVVIGITGASGAIYGVRLLMALEAASIETHLVITSQGAVTLAHEMGMTSADAQALATHAYAPQDLAAPIASGSFETHGMVIAPCSIKTLSAVAHSYTDNLLVRAADVTLKEGRPLILAVREAPFHLGHLHLMVRAAEIGAVIFPPIPAFYARPTTIEALVDQSVGRIMARLGLSNDLYAVWRGLDVTDPLVR
ncbi:MAG: UbiX family flavin prenyltransferase [Anaerolineae bacterium]|jgi:4-hydroxy-3-polyprenylbenzoate decarboxylase|nr:UbiX family flavin prenyltransferase [Anaerolineae bacterium]